MSPIRLLGLALLPLALACGSEPRDSCADGPTFTNDIQPIVEAKCLPCHSSVRTGDTRRGAPVGLDFDTYESTKPNIGAFADAITSGREPPASASLPTTRAERQTVIDWRACSFPK